MYPWASVATLSGITEQSNKNVDRLMAARFNLVLCETLSQQQTFVLEGFARSFIGHAYGLPEGLHIIIVGQCFSTLLVTSFKTCSRDCQAGCQHGVTMLA